LRYQPRILGLRTQISAYLQGIRFAAFTGIAALQQSQIIIAARAGKYPGRCESSAGQNRESGADGAC
jgi:hypothetical protein